MYEYVATTAFSKDFKGYARNSRYPKFQETFSTVLPYLLSRNPLPRKYMEHKLKGKYLGFNECHLAPDLLLIFRYKNNYVELARLGSHSELFK